MMQVRLEVTHKTGKKKTVHLSSDALIGRGHDCSLRIASSEISRRHCKLTVIESGVLVRDLESSNGTYVNDKLIPPNQDVALTPGSRLSIGPVQFVVYFESSSPTIEPPGSTVELPVVNISPDAADHGIVAESAHAATSAERDDRPAEPAPDVADPSADDPASEIETVDVDPEAVQAALEKDPPSAADDQAEAAKLTEETESESSPSPPQGKLASFSGGLPRFGRKDDGNQPNEERQPSPAMPATEAGTGKEVADTAAAEVTPAEPTDEGSGFEVSDSETAEDALDAPDDFGTEADEGDEEHDGEESDEQEEPDEELGDFLSQFDQ
jgi:pSer/pThr/pTyr-binding forkhead associated (FHA) protein